MTYNVHFWRTPEGKHDNFDALFETIENVNPDVIILQEVMEQKSAFANSRTQKKLNQLGYTHISACNSFNRGPWFGNVIASKIEPNKMAREKFKTKSDQEKKIDVMCTWI